MTELETAKAQIAQARQQLSSERTKIAEQKKQAQKQRESLLESKKKLPIRTSQKALRQTMGGLSGRAKRRKIAEVEKEISKEQKKVEEFETGLTTYETELEKYEKEKIIPIEKEIKRVEEYNAAVETVEKAAAKDMVWALAIHGEGLVQDLAKDYLEQQKLVRESFKGEVEAWESKNPGEKLIVDWKNLKVTGVQSGSLGQSIGIKQYNGLIDSKEKDIEITELKPDILKVDALPVKETSFFGKVKDAITTPIFSLVSAKDLRSSKSFKKDEFKLSSGVSNWISSGISKIQSFGDKLSSSITDISKGYKEADNKTKTIFTGNVVSAYDPSKEGMPSYVPEKSFGKKALDFISIPVASAREFSESYSALRSAEAVQGLGNVGEYGYLSPKTNEIKMIEVKSFGVPQAKVTQLSKLKVEIPKISSNIQKLDLEIKDLERNINPSGEWAGSKTDYQKYEEIIKQREKEYNLYQDRINKFENLRYIKTGFFGSGGAKTDISTLDSNRPIKSSLSLLSSAIGSTVENIAFTGGKKDIGKEVSIFSEQYGTKQTNILTGIDEPFLKETTRKLTEEDIRSQSQIFGKTASSVGMLGLYATPVIGTSLFALESAEYLGVTGSKLFSGEKLTSSEKLEGALLGGALLTAGAIKGVSILKSKATEKAIKGALKSADDIPIESLSYIKKADDTIELIGFGKDKGLSKEINFLGDVTDSYIVGTGAVGVAGEVTPKLLGFKLKPRKFVAGTEFNLGATGKGIKLTDIGDIKVFEQTGIIATQPQVSLFGQTTGTYDDLLESIATKKIKNGDLTLDIIAPVGGKRNLFLEYNENLGLSVSDKNLGIVITKPEKEVFGFKTLGKKSSDDYFKNLYSTKSTILKKDVPTENILSSLEIKDVKVNVPVSKITPISPSAFTGTGLYERTEETGVLGLKFDTGTKVKQKEITFTEFKQPTLFKMDLKTKTKIKPLQKEVSKIKPLEKLQTKAIQQPKVRTSAKQFLNQLFATKQKQANALQTISKTQTKIKTGITPKVKIKPSLKIKSKDKGTKGISFGQFEAFARKKGKDISIGKARTEKEAEELLFKKLGEELRASGFVTKGGKKVKLELEKGFRRSKIDPLRIVEEKEKRIKRKGKSGEAKEIQFFRKKNSKKNWGF